MMNCNAAFEHNPRIQARLPALRESVLRGETTAVSAANILLAEFDGSKNS